MNWLRFCTLVAVAVLAAEAPKCTRGAINEFYPVTTAGQFTINNTPVNPSDPTIWIKFASRLFINNDGDLSRFVVSNRDDDKMIVNSCKTLFKADFQGFNNLQMTAGGWGYYRLWAENCYNALFVSRMIPSKISYVATFNLNASTVKLLPADVMSPYEFENPNDGVHARGDIGDLLPAHPAKITYDAKAGEVAVRYATGGTQYFSITARGDYNHDGVEDLLVGTYYTIGGGGDLSYRELFVITRTQPNGPFRILKSFSPTTGKYPFEKWVKIEP